MSANRNYPLLLASQFLGAFGDNAILAVILGQLTFQQRAGLISHSQLGAASAVYTSLLFIPYVVFAPLAGYLNDRFAKSRWLLGGNLLKVLGTAIALVGVWHGGYWQGIGYLIVGIGGCMYSPAKYGILPEIVSHERLVKANGTLEFLTLVAILTGFIGGAEMIDRLSVVHCYVILLGLYGAAVVLNAGMTLTPTHRRVHLRGSVDEFFANFGSLLTDPRLARVLCGTGVFWVCAAVTKMNFPPWGLNVLRQQSNTQIALLGLWLSLGMMVGAVLAGQLHRVGDLRGVRPYGWSMAVLVGLLGLVELLTGAGLLKIEPLDFGAHHAGRFEAWIHAAGLGGGRWKVAFMLIGTGVLAGLFLIPLNAALQSESDQGKLGKTIATQNFVDNLGQLAAGMMVYSGVRAGLDASGIFLFLSAVLALVVTVLKVPPASAAGDSESLDPDL